MGAARSVPGPVPPGRSGVRAVLFVVGIGALVDGSLAGATGGASLLPEGSGMAFTAALAVLGAAALSASLLPSPAGALRLLADRTPRLLPFGAPRLSGAVLLLWVVLVVSVYQGLIDIFTGAHAGGTGTGVPDPIRLQLLIVLASALVWLLALYAVAVLRRLIPMGRWADSPDGKDPYGAVLAPPPSEWVSATMAASADRTGQPPSTAAVTGVVVAVSALVALGIQLAEAGTAPIPPSTWLESQLALPLYAAIVVVALRSVDASVRSVERRFRARVRPLTPAPAPVGGGFVP